MICPNCQIEAAISEQLYGALYTCSSCQAVYFINFEGQPEFGNVSEEILTEMVSEPAAATESAPYEPLQESPPETSGFEASLEPLIDAVDMVTFDDRLDAQLDERFAAQSQIDAPSQNTDSLPNLEIETNVNAKASGHSFSDVAKEISDFGNTEAQIAGLNYDLKISGLDTQEVKRLFQEAIEDLKLGWDANVIMRNIKNGQIEFSKLNPVKAYILAKRLQFLDIEKHWQQNAML